MVAVAFVVVATFFIRGLHVFLAFAKTCISRKGMIFMPDETTKRKRGRPSLSPEEKEKRILARKEYYKEYQQRRSRNWDKSEVGVKYNRERAKNNRAKKYSPSISIPRAKKSALIDIANKENTSVNKLFISLIKEKYGVDLS